MTVKNQSPLTVGNRQNIFMPIASPAVSDASKWKNNSPTPVQYAPNHSQVIRPVVQQPLQPPTLPSGNPLSGHQSVNNPNTASVIRMSPASNNNHSGNFQEYNHMNVVPGHIIQMPESSSDKSNSKNGLNQGQVFPWRSHTLMPMTNPPAQNNNEAINLSDKGTKVERMSTSNEKLASIPSTPKAVSPTPYQHQEEEADGKYIIIFLI